MHFPDDRSKHLIIAFSYTKKTQNYTNKKSSPYNYILPFEIAF